MGENAAAATKNHHQNYNHQVFESFDDDGRLKRTGYTYSLCFLTFTFIFCLVVFVFMSNFLVQDF